MSSQNKGKESTELVETDHNLDVSEVSERPYTIRDESDSNSLIHYLSPKLKEAVLKLPDMFLEITENQLKRRCRPTPTDYSLRVSFWREFERAMWRGKGRITSAQIFAGICTDTYFYNYFLKNPSKLAWMIRPLQVYQKEMEAILHRCTERLWDLVNIEITNPRTKKVDPKLADIVLKTVTQVENRVHGMAVQRTEQKSMNVNVVTRSKANQNIETMDELDARINAIEAEIKEEGGKLPAEDKPCVPIIEVEGSKDDPEVIDVVVLDGAPSDEKPKVEMPGYKVVVT